MQRIFLFCAAVLLLVGVDGGKQRCASDLDCKKDQCCALRMPDDFTVCRKMGHDIGDLCGGPYFCPQCRAGLICTPFPFDPAEFLSNDTCRLPANGTCQLNLINEPIYQNINGEFVNWVKLNVTGKLPCNSDSDCKLKQCCVKSFTGFGKECRKIGGDYGDSCGGEYFCNSCRKGLVCTSSAAIPSNPMVNSLDDGYEYDNGTELFSVPFDEIFINESTTVIQNEIAENCLAPANGTCRYPVEPTSAEDPRLPLCHIGFKRPCYDDSDCKPKECCAMHFNGRYKVCRSKSNDVGEPCGGDYFCNSCRSNLQCVELPLSPLPNESTVSTCPAPSNGTCEYIWSL